MCVSKFKKKIYIKADYHGLVSNIVNDGKLRNPDYFQYILKVSISR